MLYYDPEFKYGQNYFICTTVTAMDTILQVGGAWRVRVRVRVCEPT